MSYNSDLQVDMSDGKGQLHATARAIYQKKNIPTIPEILYILCIKVNQDKVNQERLKKQLMQ